ncbi:MAG: hypothetical protein ACKO1F_12700, partial [Flammeovirgaceae bacterium]
QPTGVSTFAITHHSFIFHGVRELTFCTSQRTDHKLQKSFHLTDPKENCEAITNTYKNNKTVSNFNFFSNALKNKN